MNKSRLFKTLILVIMGLSTIAYSYADEKMINSAISSYTKAVEKAEKNFAKAETAANIDAGYKRVSKELTTLDKRYDRYEEEVTANKEIAALHKRHMALNEKLPALEKLAKLQKVVSPYERKIKQLEKKYITEKSGDFMYLADQLQILEKHYGYVPEENRNDPFVLELKERHNNLIKLQSDAQTASNEERDAKWDRAAREKEISTLSARLCFHLLESGKNNKGVNISDLAELEEDMPGLKQFAEDCSGKYADIVADDSDVKEMAELAVNRDKYRAQLMFATYNKDLDRRINILSDEIDNLTSNDYMDSDYLDLFLYGFDEWYNEHVEFYSKGFNSIGKPVPSAKYNTLKGLKSKFADTLDTYVSNRKKWDGKGYEKPSSAFKKKASSKAKNLGFKLVEAGHEDNWFIERDEYNQPLKKYAPGYVLLKKKGESFYRLKAVWYYKVFDGEKYEEASYIQFQNTVTPVKI